MSDIKELKDKMIYVMKNSDVKYIPYMTASSFVGRYNPGRNEIVIVTDISDIEFFKTSVHEYSHYLSSTVYNLDIDEDIAYYTEYKTATYFNVPLTDNEKIELDVLDNNIDTEDKRIAEEIITKIIYLLITKKYLWIDVSKQTNIDDLRKTIDGNFFLEKNLLGLDINKIM